MKNRVEKGSMELKDKKIIVVGLARTGVAVARCCVNRGAHVTVLEKSVETADSVDARDLETLGVKLRFGPHDASALNGADMVIPSPGVTPTTPLIIEAVAAGLPVISEIELAFRLTDRPVIAVTGTNGKTTTTELLGEIFREADAGADVCGNIGRPMIEVVETSGSVGPLIVEVSSFQLEFTERFNPQIGVLLNITPDHLDWHNDFAAYAAAKLRLFRRQTTSDWAVVESGCATYLPKTAAHRALFGPSGDVYIENGWLCQKISGGEAALMPLDELRLRGAHNHANAMAAAAVALIWRIDGRIIRRAMGGFPGVEHRLEAVVQDSGVLFYNDSKATNPDAAVTALRAFDQGIILLAGGRNKGNSFSALAGEARARVKLAVLFGEAAGDIQAAFAANEVKTITVDSIEAAVRTAAGTAVEGDVVLLAPACASFDMFRDYEERGRRFKAAVLTEVGADG